MQLDISTRLNWEKCGFIQKLTSDGQRLIYENQLRTWDRIGDAYVGQQIDIRISCTYNLTLQLKETYHVAQE